MNRRRHGYKCGSFSNKCEETQKETETDSKPHEQGHGPGHEVQLARFKDQTSQPPTSDAMLRRFSEADSKNNRAETCREGDAPEICSWPTYVVQHPRARG